MSSVKLDEFEKALAKLQNLSKAQLFHTESDSDPKAWAGSKEEDEDAFGDLIDENGTDYSGVKKALAAKVEKGFKLTPAEAAMAKGQNALPLIANKISKGEKLTKAEAWALKGGYEAMKMCKGEKPSEAPAPGEGKDASSAVDTSAGKNDDEEIEQEASKSLTDAADESDILKSGLEVSPFLTEWARVQDISLRTNLASVVKSVTKAVSDVNTRIAALEKAHTKAVEEDGEFKKALSEAIVGIGQQVQGTAELATQAAQLPARGPKSATRTSAGGNGLQPIQKSFEGGGEDPKLMKSAVLDVMVDLVKSNKIHHLDVIKYETTEQMSPTVQQQVLAVLNGGSR